MSYKAVLDNNNVCVGLFNDCDMIDGIVVDCDVSGMKYENGTWIKIKKEPTEEELFQAELLLNQFDIITKQNEQDEVLAEILLNQLGV